MWKCADPELEKQIRCFPYIFSLKSETINNFPIFLAAILETLASKKWPWMQFSYLPINSSLQNNPRYQFSLKSENIEILPILSVAILKIPKLECTSRDGDPRSSEV